jgi:hypothetical protein
MAQDELFRLIDAAAAAGDPGNPGVAAAIAAATAWTAVPKKLIIDPNRAEAAVAAARAAGDPLLVNASLDAVRTVATAAGRLREAHRISSERLSLVKLMDRDDPYAAVEIEDTYNMACTDAIAAGDLPAAMETARLVEQDDLVGNHPYLTASKIIPVLVLTGAVEEALRYAPRMWDAWERAGSPAAGWLSPAVSAVALAYGLCGEDREYRMWRARAVEVAGSATAYHARHLAAFAAFVDARVAVHRGQLTDAGALVDAAFGAFPHGWYETYARASAAELAVVAGLDDGADRLSGAAAAGAENAWAAACLARATGRLHGDVGMLRTSVAAWERFDARFERACTLLLIPDGLAEGEAELATLGVRRPAG